MSGCRVGVSGCVRRVKVVCGPWVQHGLCGLALAGDRGGGVALCLYVFDGWTNLVQPWL